MLPVQYLFRWHGYVQTDQFCHLLSFQPIQYWYYHPLQHNAIPDHCVHWQHHLPRPAMHAEEPDQNIHQLSDQSHCSPVGSSACWHRCHLFPAPGEPVLDYLPAKTMLLLYGLCSTRHPEFWYIGLLFLPDEAYK